MSSESASPVANASESGEVFVMPMSFGQQRLWLIDQLTPGKSNYSLLAPLRFKGALDADVMRRTLNEIIRRHESLRTTFELEKGEPMQIIASCLELPLPLVDLTGIPPAEREVKGKAEMTRLGAIPFDLRRGPLCRAHLVRFGPQDHVLVWNMHHIISDGWSYSVLTEEIGIIYSAFCKGAPNPLPELPIQYADFTQWQRQTNDEKKVAAEVTFWRNQLSGAPESLELPTDHPRPAAQDFAGSMRTVPLSLDLSQRLAAIATGNDATFFMASFAAFFVLLYKYSGQEDLVVGTPIANRNRVEVEKLIGLFVNTLAIRVQFDAKTSFRDLLGKVRTSLLDSYNHQDLPFDRVVEDLHPTRDASRNPVFQALFLCHKAFIQLPVIPGLEVSHVHLDRRGAQLDLALAMIEREGRWRITAEYATALWAEATIDRMLGHYVRVLEQIIADPLRPISSIDLLDESERRRILVEWNDTRVSYPPEARLHQLLAAQATRTPEATALVFSGSQLTYRELEQRSNQLARHLQSLGIGPNVLVGISAFRSLEMVVGLLGILKAGGAYVPIDPEYPRDRVAFMLEDAGVSVLLTQERVLATLPAHQARTIRLDADWLTIAQEDVTPPPDVARPEDLAYMIYTSGSTGKPKGALNHHRGICNRLLWMQGRYELTAADTVLQKTPFSFDVSVWEFFWPLLTGARLVLAQPGGHQDPAYLSRLIRDERITVLHFVPSMLRAFLQEPSASLCTGLRHVVCSGEALPFDLQEKFFATLSGDLHNLYGPTEAAVDVTHWTCQRDSRLPIVPIGRPVANTQMYVLDEKLQPVPTGVAGELHIGGVQVGRGYHNRPELTAEKFITDPFASNPAARLYKTGDLARWRQEGTLEYLGRLDHQVKLRGFRIELGEIETVLAQHPSVLQAVVLARPIDGDLRLLAYLSPRNGQRAATPELRQHLIAGLPEYMIPSWFTWLEQIPLSPSGKVDRKALPNPDRAALNAQRPYEPPQTDTETRLATIFCEVLRQPRVSRLDGFFDLGGHSLMVVQLQARIESTFGLRPELRHVYDAPTIAALALHVDRLIGEQETGTI